MGSSGKRFPEKVVLFADIPATTTSMIKLMDHAACIDGDGLDFSVEDVVWGHPFALTGLQVYNLVYGSICCMKTKMLAPTFFALAAIAVLVGYFWIILQIPMPGWVKIVITFGLAALIATMGYVLFQRKREIDEEEKNDLSKY